MASNVITFCNKAIKACRNSLRKQEAYNFKDRLIRFEPSRLYKLSENTSRNQSELFTPINLKKTKFAISPSRLKDYPL